MDTLIYQVVSGLSTGSIYAAIAIALVMIYQSTGLVNFAQGEMAMISTYVAWLLIDVGVPYWGAFFLTVGLSFAFGFAVERVFVRPVASAPHLNILIVLIALTLIFNSVAGWIFTYYAKVFPTPFSSQAFASLGFISPHALGLIGITLVVVLVLYLFFTYTPLGLVMRAAAQNPESSRLCGIRVGLMQATGWGIAAAIGAIAGILVAPLTFLEPNMMAGVIIYGFAAALLGGIDNPWGAVLGGFIVGVVENLAGAYVVGTELKLTVALVIIVGVLIVKPTGLLGRSLVSRV
jgi:branched-chain amino acid transport system permease protein